MGGSKARPGEPRCDEPTISTKTKALFLNQEVDIDAVFWDIAMGFLSV
jgi:hypothetical protein